MSSVDLLNTTLSAYWHLTPLCLHNSPLDAETGFLSGVSVAPEHCAGVLFWLIRGRAEKWLDQSEARDVRDRTVVVAPGLVWGRSSPQPLSVIRLSKSETVRLTGECCGCRDVNLLIQCRILSTFDMQIEWKCSMESKYYSSCWS